MNRTPRLSESGIEYLDYVWNFYSGCLNWRNGICPVENCWAKSITERFKHHYPNSFDPTYYPEAFLSPLYLKKPSIIGVAFMGDLFGDWVDPDKKRHSIMPSGKASISMSLKGWVFTTIRQCPQHTFLFLTKCPQNLPKWGTFPDNCWAGVTVTNWVMLPEALYHLSKIKASVRYISFEPLLEFIPVDGLNLVKHNINWVIIGAQTKPYSPPQVEWVREVVEACDEARIPVFLKDNLMPLFKGTKMLPYWALDKTQQSNYRQEMPNV